MNRADMLRQSAALAALASAAFPREGRAAEQLARILPLKAPAQGVPVAFLLSDGAVMIDFSGPWEVFQDVQVPGEPASGFTPYTVAQTTAPLSLSGGARIVPGYDFEHAPAPKVVVVPAQSAPTDAAKQWLRKAAQSADVVMSVCTGAFVLAAAGLLDGLSATTHHGSLARLAMSYPRVTVKRGVRFVDNGHIATSAGLSAGIDLALHVAARYYGPGVARDTAYYLEYLSQGWSENSNAAYREPPQARAGYALCAVCWMEVDPKVAIHTTYHGKRYYFCMQDHERLFESAPRRFIDVA